ncbi:hypothetical protein Bpfe_018907, partial [Biomphalaria pfeifferi]
GTMEASLLAIILSVGMPLMVLSEIIAWKLWPKWSKRESVIKRKTVASTIVFDPLVSAIVCPLTADLYSSVHVMECDPSFVVSIVAVMTLVYVSALIVCFRLLTIMSPRSKSEVDTNEVTASFCLSVAVNALLTWVVLSLLQPSRLDAVVYDSEACLVSVRQKSSIFIFVMCMAIQMVHVLFYACLSNSVVGKYKRELYADEAQADELEDTDRRSIWIYTLASLFSLVVTNLLRMCFTHCSCQHFLLLANGLYLTNWVIAFKLPLSGFIYFLVNKFVLRTS